MERYYERLGQVLVLILCLSGLIWPVAYYYKETVTQQLLEREIRTHVADVNAANNALTNIASIVKQQGSPQLIDSLQKLGLVIQ